jgi:ribonucleoside-diphosphate reductase alpha chain
MEVVKRNQTREPVCFDKITQRITNLCSSVFAPYSSKAIFGSSRWSKTVRDFGQRVRGSELTNVDPILIAHKVAASLCDGVTTSQIDVLSAEIAKGFKLVHPEYGVLASRLILSNLHKEAPATFLASVRLLGKDRYDAELYDAIAGLDSSFRESLEAAIDDSRSYSMDYFAIKTLLSGYLLRVGDGVAERPSHMFMRVALTIHGNHDLPRVLGTYRLLSEAAFSHASPTLFSSGTKKPQLASCFRSRDAGIDDAGGEAHRRGHDRRPGDHSRGQGQAGEPAAHEPAAGEGHPEADGQRLASHLPDGQPQGAGEGR